MSKEFEFQDEQETRLRQESAPKQSVEQIGQVALESAELEIPDNIILGEK